MRCGPGSTDRTRGSPLPPRSERSSVAAPHFFPWQMQACAASWRVCGQAGKHGPGITNISPVCVCVCVHGNSSVSPLHCSACCSFTLRPRLTPQRLTPKLPQCCLLVQRLTDYVWICYLCAGFGINQKKQTLNQLPCFAICECSILTLSLCRCVCT